MLNADDKFSWHLVEQPPFQIGASICILLPIHRRPANPRRHFGCIPRCWHQYWVIIYSVPAVLYTQPCRGLGTVKIPFTSILCNFFLVFKYIFLTPEVYIRGPVSSLLGFYSIWSYNIQVQPLNGQPWPYSCLTYGNWCFQLGLAVVYVGPPTDLLRTQEISVAFSY